MGGRGYCSARSTGLTETLKSPHTRTDSFRSTTGTTGVAHSLYSTLERIRSFSNRVNSASILRRSAYGTWRGLWMLHCRLAALLDLQISLVAFKCARSLRKYRLVLLQQLIIIKALFKTERPISEVREEDAGLNRWSVSITGQLILRDGAISHNWPQIASDRTIWEK